MNTLYFKISAAALLAATALAGTAQAGVTFTYSPFGAAGLPTGDQIVVDFDNPNATGYNYTQSSGSTQVFTPASSSFDTGVYNDSPGSLISGIAAAPALGGGQYDQTNFESVLTGGSFNLSTPGVTSLSVYIGSADTYNEIQFENKSGQVIQSYGGLDIMPAANGDQALGSTNGRVDFDFGGEKVYNVVFSASGNSFEFDNIAAPISAAPEPASWALMLIGVGGFGAALRMRRKAEGDLAALPA